MDTLVMVGQLLLGLSILVGLHELGHLLTAKMFGMRVEKFSIGFPPTIFKIKWGETEYAIGAIPLGGFVKIAGMIDESMDKEFLNKEPEPWEFRSKPAWQRLIVMLGGIIVNVITGIIIFMYITYSYGENYIPASKAEYGIVALDIAKEEVGLQTGDKIIAINGKPYDRFSDVKDADVILGSNVFYTIERDGKTLTKKVPADIGNRIQREKGNYIEDIPRTKDFEIVEVADNSTADKIGLKKGDKVVGINGTKIEFYHELQKALKDNANKKVTLTIQRGDEKIKKETTIAEDGKLGFIPKLNTSLFVQKEFTFGEAAVKGTKDAFGIVITQIKGFRKMFKGEMNASESLSGPIGIGKIYGSVWVWSKFWYITGFLSMVLAFMNFLPIPALDGGHVVFITYEMISGKAPSPKFLENAQKVGFFLLIGIMVFAISNDIYKEVIRKYF